MSITVALAADHGIHMKRSHFGHADRYVIYTLENDRWIHSATVDHPEQEHRQKKFQEIVDQLQAYGVNAVVAVQYGPNLKRLKQFFAPILVSEVSLEEALELIGLAREEIVEQIQAGTERSHISLRR